MRYEQVVTQNTRSILGNKSIIIWIGFVFLFLSNINAQRVTNVTFQPEGESTKVTYTLLGAPAGISIHISTDNGENYGKALTAVSGDVGANIKPGQRNIYVDTKKEIGNKVPMEKIKFKVCATSMLDGFEMEVIFVEGGTFTMGGTNEQDEDSEEEERPVHIVRLSNYFIGKYEVTQKQWKAIMGNNPSTFKGDDLPVENVSFSDVQSFIEKLNTKTGKTYRLPTEAEWEYAARGGRKSRSYKYSGSENIFNVAWCWSNSSSSTYSVGQKQPNELGIYDMSGNVWEWCQDYFGEYPNSIQVNPKGPEKGSKRILRGGSWSSYAKRCRVSNRESYHAGSRYYDVGFRLILVRK